MKIIGLEEGGTPDREPRKSAITDRYALRPSRPGQVGVNATKSRAVLTTSASEISSRQVEV